MRKGKFLHITSISDNLEIQPSLVEAFYCVFKVANDEGLKGNKLENLEFLFPYSADSTDFKITIQCSYAKKNT